MEIPRTRLELDEALQKLLPGAQVETDNYGQIVIYTNLQEGASGKLEPFIQPEEDS